MKNLDIIILHYGDVSITKRCVDSIEKFAKGYRNILLINNDPSIAIEKEFSQSKKRKVFNTRENIGFARGVNFGIKLALENNADYVMLMNNDVTVTDDFIKPLLRFLEKNNAATIVSPVVQFQEKNKTHYFHGGFISRISGDSKNNNAFEISQKQFIEVDFVSGCSMLIKKEVFREIGLFDEQFFMYYEDVDFCLRAKKADLSIFIVPSAIIQHEGSMAIGKNSSNAVYHLVKSHIKFSKKHKEFPLGFVFIFIQIMKFIIKMPMHTFVFVRAMRGN